MPAGRGEVRSCSMNARADREMTAVHPGFALTLSPCTRCLREAMVSYTRRGTGSQVSVGQWGQWRRNAGWQTSHQAWDTEALLPRARKLCTPPLARTHITSCTHTCKQPHNTGMLRCACCTRFVMQTNIHIQRTLVRVNYSPSLLFMLHTLDSLCMLGNARL